jgi:cell division septum initiation protein DivIVA
MDIAGRLQQLEDIVQEAKSMPLSSSVLINKDEVLELLHDMQEDLPEEIKQARWVVKDREELLAKARAEGDRIIEQAHEEQLRLARKEEIARRAEEESDRVVAEADEKARSMREESTTRALAKTLDQVEVGRERLRAPVTAAEQRLTSEEPSVVETALYDEEEDAE